VDPGSGRTLYELLKDRVAVAYTKNTGVLALEDKR
jgi:hypothetical protein